MRELFQNTHFPPALIAAALLIPAVYLSAFSAGDIDSYYPQVTATHSCGRGTEPSQAVSAVSPGTHIPPHIELNVSVSPKMIWPEQSEGSPKNATVTLSVSGAGGPAIAFKPQDTVLVIDNSQSMRYISDPNDLRLNAAKHYVENMIQPDRCAVVVFSSDANLVNNRSLTDNYTQVGMDIDTLYGTAAGQTNFNAAFSVVADELTVNGKEGHVSIVIFLTDGHPEPENTNITMETLNRLKDCGITVFTIGLGQMQDRNLLKWIACETNGTYYDAPNASALDEIYSDISNQFRDYTATKGGKTIYVVPEYLNVQNGTLTNDSCTRTDSLDGTTIFEWVLPLMTITESWTVSFNVTSTKTGWVSVGVLPLSRTVHTTANGTPETKYFPDTLLWVIPPTPTPPPMPLPPPAPPSPIPVPPPAMMAPVSQAAVTVQPIFSVSTVAQPAGITAAELLAPFFALGIGSLARMKRRVKTKRTIDIGVRERGRRLDDNEKLFHR